MNCELNGVYVDTSSDDVIGSKIGDWDVVFLGDMFYDSDFADLFSQWLPRLSRSGVNIYVGDPGRLPLVNHPLKRNLVASSGVHFRKTVSERTMACLRALCGNTLDSSHSKIPQIHNELEGAGPWLYAILLKEWLYIFDKIYIIL